MKLADKIILKLMDTIADQRRDIVVPNYCYMGYEADLITITMAGIFREYEIKVTRSDFFADFKKLGKHNELKAGQLPPNHFSFVVPEGLVSLDEVPLHCGLIYVTDSGYMKVIRAAKKLHNNRFDGWKMLCRKLSAREYFYKQKARKQLLKTK